MENNDPTRKEDVQDPIGKLGWPQEKGRDGERTPMQWDATPNGGFSVAKPWLPVPASAATHNVASELKDQNSVLQFYRRLLKLRHENHALLDGEYIALNESDENVLSYLRRYKDKAVLVVLNMSGAPQKASIDLSTQGFANAKPNVLLTTLGDAGGMLGDLTLEPFAVYIAEVSK
jgi:alpha-glucosidase